MSKIKLSIIALSCVMALSACSSSSKGGTDNTDQIRQLENELNQKIAEATQKAEAAAKGSNSDSSSSSSNSGSSSSSSNSSGTKESYTYTLSSDLETKLKELEKLLADEKARVSLGDKIFGGSSGNMTDAISGGVLIDKQNIASRPQTRDIRDLTIIDEKGD